MAWLSRKKIEQMKFLSIGKNVLLSDKASFYNCSKIEIGNNVRVDDFCVLSAGDKGISIGNYVHIAVYSSIIGQGKIGIDDFCNISSRVALYSSNDDYSGAYLTNPMVSTQYTNVQSADIGFKKHVIIGSGSIILPGVTLGIGVVVGALSLVKESCESFGIYVGTPAKYIKKRKQNLLALEKVFLEQEAFLITQ